MVGLIVLENEAAEGIGRAGFKLSVQDRIPNDASGEARLLDVAGIRRMEAATEFARDGLHLARLAHTSRRVAGSLAHRSQAVFPERPHENQQEMLEESKAGRSAFSRRKHAPGLDP